MADKQVDEFVYETWKKLDVIINDTKYSVGAGFFFHYTNKDKTITFCNNGNGCDESCFIIWNVSPEMYEDFLEQCEGSIMKHV